MFDKKQLLQIGKLLEEVGPRAMIYMLKVLPPFISNDKGTKFFLTMKAYELKASKGWQVSYVYTGARAVVRKGYPIIKADTLPEALEQMLTWFNDNHSEQLNWD